MSGRIVKTERLILRPFTMDDLDAYAAIRRDERVAHWLPGGVAMVPDARRIAGDLIAQWSRTWEEGGYAPWAIVDGGSGTLLGHGGLRYLAQFEATEILYTLAPAAWGQGFARECAAAARDEAFSFHDLPRVIALALPDNQRSQGVMRAIGMQLEGTTEAFGHAAVQYALDRAGWERLQEPSMRAAS